MRFSQFQTKQQTEQKYQFHSYSDAANGLGGKYGSPFPHVFVAQHGLVFQLIITISMWSFLLKPVSATKKKN